MLIKEYRVILPLTLEEYQIGQLYCTAEASRENTGGGEGIVVEKNEPFTDKKDLFEGYTSGQYTYKIYKMESKVPAFVKVFISPGRLDIHEEAWNAYPYCRTVLKNPGFMKDDFELKIETLHVQDGGLLENAHQLSPVLLKKRDVSTIDISRDHIPKHDYKADEDPGKFQSTVVNRGPLGPNWIDEYRAIAGTSAAEGKPLMCAYKLVTVEFKMFGFQNRVEKYVINAEQRLFTTFHRKVFCTIDKWHGKTIQDIRELENETKAALETTLDKGEKRGMIVE
ncbi:hypothetical protein SNEBB_008401 [Seison nebaliae]|nr:hypothetical protein SNEBB_008401 [Seison nebaliae]